MTHTVHFADKSVLFTAEPPSEPCFVVRGDDAAAVRRDKIVKILETHNPVAVVAADPDAAFAAFAAGFAQIEAAGGIVVDGGGAYLMIRRNGRWDLPKGRLEPGERIEACAAREVEEETGVAARVVRPLCTTWHAYFFRWTDRWELKRTHWFELRATGGSPRPQTEEGIESVEWCSRECFARRAAASYPTIRHVAAAMASGR